MYFLTASEFDLLQVQGTLARPGSVVPLLHFIFLEVNDVLQLLPVSVIYGFILRGVHWISELCHFRHLKCCAL